MSISTLSQLGRLLVTTGGLGYMRPASGTWGSMPTVILAAALLLGLPALEFPALDTQVVYHGVLVAIMLLFSWACVHYGDAAEAHFNKKDPGYIVADETAGQVIPLLLLPASALATPQHLAITLAAAFVLFRIFDIAKLWPANGLQRVPGGWGVLLDDLVAGLQAAIVLQVALRIVW